MIGQKILWGLHLSIILGGILTMMTGRMDGNEKRETSFVYEPGRLSYVLVLKRQGWPRSLSE
jgi:hypothetical protein